MEYIQPSALVISILLNLFLYYMFLKNAGKNIKKLDVNAQDLLHDLTRSGQAILRVQVLDAENLLLRSPRG